METGMFPIMHHSGLLVKHVRMSGADGIRYDNVKCNLFI